MHYNGGNSYLFVDGTDIFRFKAKDSEIVSTRLCLGNISKHWSVDNMKQTGFNGYVYDFSVDYDDIIWWTNRWRNVMKILMKQNQLK